MKYMNLGISKYSRKWAYVAIYYDRRDHESGIEIEELF